MNASKISLEDVANKFQIWRSKKQSKFEPTPNHLKILLQKLLPYYPKNKIVNKLKISPLLLEKSGDINNLIPNNTSTNTNTSTKNNNPYFNHSNFTQYEQLGFIPLQLSDLQASQSLSQDCILDKKSKVNTDISLNSAASSASNITCEIIKPDGIKLVIYNPDTNSVIRAFLCSI